MHRLMMSVCVHMQAEQTARLAAAAAEHTAQVAAVQVRAVMLDDILSVLS